MWGEFKSQLPTHANPSLGVPFLAPQVITQYLPSQFCSLFISSSGCPNVQGHLSIVPLEWRPAPIPSVLWPLRWFSTTGTFSTQFLRKRVSVRRFGPIWTNRIPSLPSLTKRNLRKPQSLLKQRTQQPSLSFFLSPLGKN